MLLRSLIIEVQDEPDASIMAHQTERVETAFITQNIQPLVNILIFKLLRAGIEAEEKEKNKFAIILHTESDNSV